jgi:hypothetical protein
MGLWIEQNMSWNPLDWGARTLKAAVDLRLKSAVRSVLFGSFSFITLLLSPMLTDHYFVRSIVTYAALAVFIGECLNILYRSWFSKERN